MTDNKKPTAPKNKKVNKSKQTPKHPVKKETAVAETPVETAVTKAPIETVENKPAGKVLGSIAGKMLNLTQIGAKKLEDYANKSAEENNNENARKLASAMSRFSQTIETNQDQYIEGVEKNAEELINISKQTFGSMKKIYNEMKKRAKTAKQKAEQDVKIADEENNNEEDK